jgi:type IV secretory pathway VirB10-like protein
VQVPLPAERGSRFAKNHQPSHAASSLLRMLLLESVVVALGANCIELKLPLLHCTPLESSKMGNVISEEENDLLEEAYSMSLESPEADKVLNQGTSAPNCQPKHTAAATSTVSEREDQGQEVVMKEEDGPESEGDDGKSQSHTQLNAKHRRGSSVSDEEERRKRQHTNGQQQQQQLSAQQQKKLSYFQMAKMGYQELVNAIIRPPRADYKVSLSSMQVFVFRLLLFDTVSSYGVYRCSHSLSFC